MRFNENTAEALAPLLEVNRNGAKKGRFLTRSAQLFRLALFREADESYGALLAAFLDEAAFADGQELVECGGGAVGELGFQRGQNFAPTQTAAVDHLVGCLELLHVIRREALTFESDAVQANDFRRDAVQQDIGRRVQRESAHATDHGVRSDAAELVDRRGAAQIGVAANGHVPGAHHVVRHDHAVADMAIVRDVRIDHQHVVVADRRCGILFQGTMQRDVFADGIVVADQQLPDVSVRAKMLRPASQYRALADRIIAAQSRALLDRDSAIQTATIADDHVVLHDTKRADGNVAAKLCLGTDGRGGMNVRHGGSLSMCPSQAVRTLRAGGKPILLIGFAERSD